MCLDKQWPCWPDMVHGKEVESSTYMGPIIAVTPENIEAEWLAGFGQELPRELKKALEKR